MGQSFIAGSAILCHFMLNDRLIWGSSIIPSIPPQKILCRLKDATKFIGVVFVLNICIKASYPKWTHIIVVAQVSMLMRDDRILSKLCWMPEAKMALYNILKLKP